LARITEGVTSKNIGKKNQRKVGQTGGGKTEGQFG